MDDCALDGVKIHFVNERILVGTEPLDGDDSRLARGLKDLFKSFLVDGDRSRGVRADVNDRGQNARMPQGPQPPAEIKVSGRTEFGTKDTDASVILEGASLPYFQLYYRQVTQAVIDSAVVGSRINLFIEHNDLTLDADLAVSDLSFRVPASEEQFFGLRADEILSFLRDRSGRFKFQIEARWNITDRNLNVREVIRQSIERSLKKTVIGNVPRAVRSVLRMAAVTCTEET